ncbi:uncharacterized protein L969DRAFT_55148 [Mixia osmundae IAM 14324]|uniref:DNA 3'-5' helicase n=1 Tax=Mixia osmundae (strain CBS 9802 / IAM 14324 / JCM 22182 / KY 12970) TaxID=764103 RepID=G7DUL1_MIXOS|nr:uncharacterized protein L969DRAFT_55148 [Mixia osmundae IAM 14324]KEI36395.1 hypothetical protein L969DRAFT_55148 [Mixia osmundae IAM 14324]GAA94271.1 hypothetical protein E5Q_00920 [Mixia osmundae IAM 14324]
MDRSSLAHRRDLEPDSRNVYHPSAGFRAPATPIRTPTSLSRPFTPKLPCYRFPQVFASPSALSIDCQVPTRDSSETHTPDARNIGTFSIAQPPTPFTLRTSLHTRSGMTGTPQYAHKKFVPAPYTRPPSQQPLLIPQARRADPSDEALGDRRYKAQLWQGPDAARCLGPCQSHVGILARAAQSADWHHQRCEGSELEQDENHFAHERAHSPLSEEQYWSDDEQLSMALTSDPLTSPTPVALPVDRNSADAAAAAHERDALGSPDACIHTSRGCQANPVQRKTSGMPSRADESRQARYQQGQATPLSRLPTKPAAELRSTTALPDAHRSCFPFTTFNIMQSQCYESVYQSDSNVVVSAPTSSGKTVLFELGVLRALSANGRARAIYFAPTKSLCAERLNAWSRKFLPLGFACAEITGDTDVHNLAVIKQARVIVTTPEKWDSITRRWPENQAMLSSIALICIDECHTLNEKRGSTLEVIVMRMRSRVLGLRVIAVSATVPNVSDVAQWLHASDGSPAICLSFGDEVRPCALTRAVCAYPRKPQTNDFVFARSLDSKLIDVVQKYCDHRPALIFCNSRKACAQAAETLVADIGKAKAKPWPRSKPMQARPEDSTLAYTTAAGIGFHHAGLSQRDRQLIEQSFLDGALHAICTTSTLAVGVNLPAYAVIIKGTRIYSEGSMQDYSNLDMLQMAGRAGRPQFDKSGVVVIMTDNDSRSKYEHLTASKTTVESCLHTSLAEHINAECQLGTITSFETAIAWIKSSFLRVRIGKNPRLYGIIDDTVSPDAKLEEIVRDCLLCLVRDGIMSDQAGLKVFACTPYGGILSKFCISHKTFAKLLAASDSGTMRGLLEAIASADEFSTMRLTTSDRQAYAEAARKHNIRFEVAKVGTVKDKIFVLVQLVISRVSMHESKSNASFHSDHLQAWPHLLRITKALVEICLVSQHGASIRAALELMRSINARAWEGSKTELQQIDGIGDKFAEKLASARPPIHNLLALRQTDSSRLELLLHKNQAICHRMIQQARSYPQLTVEFEKPREQVREEGVVVDVDVRIAREDTSEAAQRPKKATRDDSISLLITTTDDQFVYYSRIKSSKLVAPRVCHISTKLVKASQKLVAYASSDVVVGLAVRSVYTPHTRHDDFPRRHSSPSELAGDHLRLLEGLEADDFTSELDAPSATAAANVASSSSKVSTPERLPNGNYRCGHSCVDRKRCRHLCCREGTHKPPAAHVRAVASKKQAHNAERKSQAEGHVKIKAPPLRQLDIAEQLKIARESKKAQDALRHAVLNRVKIADDSDKAMCDLADSDGSLPGVYPLMLPPSTPAQVTSPATSLGEDNAHTQNLKRKRVAIIEDSDDDIELVHKSNKLIDEGSRDRPHEAPLFLPSSSASIQDQYDILSDAEDDLAPDQAADELTELEEFEAWLRDCVQII